MVKGGKTKETPKERRKSNNNNITTKTHELFNDASREVNDTAM
jgi:hypothetical protein